MVLFGADIEGLNQLALSFDSASERVRRLTAETSSAVSEIGQFWHGRDADEFSHLWTDRHRPQLLLAADELRKAATTATQQADEQRIASQADAGAAPPAGQNPTIVPLAHTAGPGGPIPFAGPEGLDLGGSTTEPAPIEIDPTAEPFPSPIRDSFVDRIEAIDEGRRDELDVVADQIILDNATVGERFIVVGNHVVSTDHLELTHNDVARVLLDIDAMDISEDEKMYLWHQIAHGKEVPDVRNAVTGVPPSGRVITTDSGEELSYAITSEGADPAVVNDDFNGPGNTSAHTVVHFYDGYHVPLADLPPEEAAAVIAGKEGAIDSRILGAGQTNQGDIEASERTAALLREYAETGDFTVLAQRWPEYFVGPPTADPTPSPGSPPDVAGTTTTTTTTPGQSPRPTTTIPPSEQPPGGTTTTTTTTTTGPQRPTTTIPDNGS